MAAVSSRCDSVPILLSDRREIRRTARYAASDSGIRSFSECMMPPLSAFSVSHSRSIWRLACPPHAAQTTSIGSLAASFCGRNSLLPQYGHFALLPMANSRIHRSEEHTSELQSPSDLVFRLLL